MSIDRKFNYFLYILLMVAAAIVVAATMPYKTQPCQPKKEKKTKRQTECEHLVAIVVRLIKYNAKNMTETAVRICIITFHSMLIKCILRKIFIHDTITSAQKKTTNKQTTAMPIAKRMKKKATITPRIL